jgi:hypothetical protein
MKFSFSIIFFLNNYSPDIFPRKFLLLLKNYFRHKNNKDENVKSIETQKQVQQPHDYLAHLLV